jgi:peroxiredoxin
MSARRDATPLFFRAAGRIALLFALCLGVAGLTSRPAAADDPFKTLALIRPPRTRVAPTFTVSALNGPSIRLTDYRGRVVLLNFWATWCPACQSEMPALERLYQAFKARGFAVLAISIDADGRSAVEPFVRERPFTVPIGLDPKMTVADRYGVQALPTTVLVDRNGNRVAWAVGPREWDAPDARAVVELLLDRR